MTYKTIFFVMGFALAGLTVTSCNNSTGPNSADTSDIQALIQAEDSLVSLDGFQDADSDSFAFHQYGRRRGQFRGPFLPWFVRRTIDSLNRNIDIEKITEDSALVTLTTAVTGVIHIGIDADTTNDTRVDTVWNKPFDITATRRLAVVRTAFPNGMRRHMGSRHNGWRIAGMTPLMSESSGSDLTVNSVTLMNVSKDVTVTITDPQNTFLNWSNMPTLTAGDSIAIIVDLTNGDNSGTTVLARYRMRGRFRASYSRFFDDGQAPDETANDNKYTGGWMLARMPGMRHAAIEVIDNSLLTDPSADYNALLWSMPYLVQRGRRMGM